MKITKLPSVFQNKRLFLSVFILLVLLYLLISYIAIESNLYPAGSLRIGAEEMLNRANGLSFINSGNYATPLFTAINYYLIPEWPTLIPIVFGSFIIAYIILFIFNNFQSRLLKVLLSLFIAFLPSNLYIITTNPELTLLIVLFSLTMYFILEFTLNERVFYLFMAAITFGLQFYILFEIIWFVFFLAGYFSIVYARRKKTINFIVTISFPIVFFLMSWLFLMWIFKADINTFIRENLTFNIAAGIDRFHEYLQQNFYSRWPVMILYLYILFTLGKFRHFFVSPLFLAFISPLVVALTLVLGNISIDSSFFIMIAMINLIILFPYLGPLFNERRQKKIIIFFILFIFIFDVYSALNLRQGKEKAFFCAVQDKCVYEEIAEYKAVAETIRGFDHVLTDWEETYGVIYFHEDTSIFLTTKTPGYINLSLNPQLYADALLFYKFGETYDRYDKNMLCEYFDTIPAHESENFIVFRRKEGGAS